jgi:uncharacterized membrane protein
MAMTMTVKTWWAECIRRTFWKSSTCLFAPSTGQSITVGEFYHNLEVNNRSIMTTIHGSWLLQLVFVVIGILILFVLVRAAHDTINWQQGN